MPEWARPNVRRFLSTLAVWLAIWFVPLFALHARARQRPRFRRRGAVLLQDGRRHLRRRLCGAGLCGAAGGRGLSLAEAGRNADRPWPRRNHARAADPGAGVCRLSGRRAPVRPRSARRRAAGRAVTLWFTFVPCFLWIFVGAPYVETLRNVRWLASALAAVTAAVVGIIANLAVWFALHVLFGDMSANGRSGRCRCRAPDFATIDLAAAAIAIAAGIALIRYQRT